MTAFTQESTARLCANRRNRFRFSVLIRVCGSMQQIHCKVFQRKLSIASGITS